MIVTHTLPETAAAAAVLSWASRSDRAGLVPAVFESDSGFEPGVWPRARLNELPEGAWVVHARTAPRSEDPEALCRRYAARLNELEIAPTGDDFNALLDLLNGGAYTDPKVGGR